MNRPAPAGDSTGLPLWVFALAVLLLGFGLLAWTMLHRARGPSPQTPQYKLALPDSRLTPGDVLTRNTRRICTPGYTQTVRSVPEAIKQQVYREYGITSHTPGEYEVDHLVSLELGGSNSIRNLWPQSYRSRPLNAHLKDQVENRLHELVCAGKLPLEEAQQLIAQDWVAAYRRYVGPVPP